MARSAIPEANLAEMLLHATTRPAAFYTELMWRGGAFAGSEGWMAMFGHGSTWIGYALVEDARIRFDVFSRYADLVDGFLSGERRPIAEPFWD
jgi:hypothetical protein